jgi:type IX secretion system PorP/SprF family membrane protein
VRSTRHDVVIPSEAKRSRGTPKGSTKLTFSLFVLLLLCSKTIAQTDFPVSIVTTAPTLLNPAETGLLDNKFRVHAKFKSQVARSLAGGVKATGVAIDYNLEDYKMGVGFSVFSNSLNRTALRDFNLLVSYGYRMYLSDWNMLAFGIQAGFKQVGFNLEELSFGSQFDPTYKGGFDPNRPPEYLFSDNKNSLDAAVGTSWTALIGQSILLKTGVSAFHLIPVRTDFETKNTKLTPQYVFLLETRYIGDPFHWIPSVMHVSQGNHSYTEMGMTIQFRDGDKFVNAGLFHRTPNVVIPTVGIGMDQISVNLSLEYYVRNNFSQIFNISLVYLPKFDLPKLQRSQAADNVVDF